VRALLICEFPEIEFADSAVSFCLPEEPLKDGEIVMATPEGAVDSSLSRRVHDEGHIACSVKHDHRFLRWPHFDPLTPTDRIVVSPV